MKDLQFVEAISYKVCFILCLRLENALAAFPFQQLVTSWDVDFFQMSALSKIHSNLWTFSFKNIRMQLSLIRIKIEIKI